jgi:hypothetical protein
VRYAIDKGADDDVEEECFVNKSLPASSDDWPSWPKFVEFSWIKRLSIDFTKHLRERGTVLPVSTSLTN